MTTQGRPDGKLRRAVEQRRERDERWRREGERPLAKNLALVGVLGWLVVVPALLGTFAGRAVDRALGTGVTFTSAFMCLGVAVGAFIGWKHVRSA